MAGKDKALDLISRHKLLCGLKRQEPVIIDGRVYLSLDTVLEKVRIAPGVEEKVQVHGEWVAGCLCSVCGKSYGPRHKMDKAAYRYCPCCGAKMDGGAHDQDQAK